MGCLQLNLRKMNASERSRIYSKFSLIVAIIVLLAIYLPLSHVQRETKEYEIPLENRTCEDIFNKAMNNTLFSDDGIKKYNPEAVMLYYLEKCG